MSRLEEIREKYYGNFKIVAFQYKGETITDTKDEDYAKDLYHAVLEDVIGENEKNRYEYYRAMENGRNVVLRIEDTAIRDAMRAELRQKWAEFCGRKEDGK